jgi:hypothetical protein
MLPISEQEISKAKNFAFIPVSPKLWPRPPAENGRSYPDWTFHHQKANAVKDKIALGPEGLCFVRCKFLPRVWMG